MIRESIKLSNTAPPWAVSRECGHEGATLGLFAGTPFERAPQAELSGDGHSML